MGGLGAGGLPGSGLGVGGLGAGGVPSSGLGVGGLGTGLGGLGGPLGSGLGAGGLPGPGVGPEGILKTIILVENYVLKVHIIINSTTMSTILPCFRICCGQSKKIWYDFTFCIL